MRRQLRVAAAVLAVGSLSASTLSASGRGKGAVGRCPPAGDECVQAPAGKVVVELSPPEVIFKQPAAAPGCAPPAPACAPTTVIIQKHGLLRRLCDLGHCEHQPVAVAQPVATPVLMAVPQMTVPTVSMTPTVPVAMTPSYTPQYTVPVAFTPQLTPSFAPQYTPQFAPQYAPAPNFSPGGCQGSSGGANFSPNGGNGQDLLNALGLLQRLAQAAPAAGNSGASFSPAQNTPTNPAARTPAAALAAPVGSGSLEERYSELQRRIQRLEKIIAATTPEK